MIHPISLLIKPASSLCNLDCRYCFYKDIAKNREEYSHKIMDINLLEDIIMKAFEYTRGQDVYLSFQGGEPTIAGYDFFEKVKSLLVKHNIYDSNVYLSIQTNATLIDEKWAQLFARDHYLVGVSLDGNKKANYLREDLSKNPSFDKVMESINLLKKYNVHFNILSVVTKYNAKHIKEVYAFFKGNGFKNLQFIPCLKPLDGNIKEDFYMDEDEYAHFMLDCFELYMKDIRNNDFTSIRQFDNFVLLAHHQNSEQCGMNGHCNHHFVIESNGEVYPCDFYCLDEYSLGFIQDTTFEKMELNPVAINFIKESMVVEEKCKKCAYYKMCKNGCKRERIDLAKCKAYQSFFKVALPYLMNIH